MRILLGALAWRLCGSSRCFSITCKVWQRQRFGNATKMCKLQACACNSNAESAGMQLQIGWTNFCILSANAKLPAEQNHWHCQVDCIWFSEMRKYHDDEPDLMASSGYVQRGNPETNCQWAAQNALQVAKALLQNCDFPHSIATLGMASLQHRKSSIASKLWPIPCNSFCKCCWLIWNCDADIINRS